MTNFYVCLCAHNGNEFISNQIDSILNQSYNSVHIFAFDFSSSDGTDDIIKEYSEKHSNVSFVKFDYAPGAKESFYIGLDYVNSRVHNGWILLSDQDDVWCSNKLDRLNDLIGLYGDNIELMYHDVNLIDERGELLAHSYYGLVGRDPIKESVLSQLVLSNVAIGHTMCFSKEFLSEILSLSVRDCFLMHDWFLFYCAKNRKTELYINEVLSGYRQHSNNVLGVLHENETFIIKIKRLDRFLVSLDNQLRCIFKCVSPCTIDLPAWIYFLFRKDILVAFGLYSIFYIKSFRRKLIGLLLILRSILTRMLKIITKVSSGHSPS
jgi:glycosyltransferase involved in cell wall biosynthesis